MERNALLYLFGKLWKYSAGRRVKMSLVWTMFMLAELVSLFAEPFIIAKIIQVALDEGVSQHNIVKLFLLSALLLAVSLFFWSLHGPARVMEIRNAFQTRADYRKHLLSGVLRLGLGWHSENHSGDTIDRIEKGTNSLYDFASDTFELVYSFVQLVVAFIVLTYFLRSATLVAVVFMAVTMYIVCAFDKVLIGHYKDLSKAENKIAASTYDAISNVSTIITLRVEKSVFEALVKKIDEPFDLFKRNTVINEWKWFLSSKLCTLTTISCLSIYFWQKRGAAPGVLVGSIYLMTQCIGTLTRLFERFTSLYSNIVRKKARVLNSEELSAQFTEGSLFNHVLPERWQQVQVENLTFSYPKLEGEESRGLVGVNLNINRGEKIALVGKSGSGKSTFLKVVRGLYVPQDITLRADGKLVRGGFDGIARAISLIPQSTEVFNSTILENLTMGVDYSMSDIHRMCEVSDFTQVINQLPKGLSTRINERGVNLSGGQQQRLGLTRGLLASMDKDIILLDEPTSSLDEKTSRVVFENILEKFSSQTVIASVHDLRLLPLFDRVIMFEEGRVVYSGPSAYFTMCMLAV